MSLRRRGLSRALFAVLVLALLVLLLGSVRIGSTGSHGVSTTLRGVLAVLGLGEPLAGTTQTIVELRLWRALTAAGVGASLALSGALLQGLFRNGLASPSVIGVTAGASLGAALAIVILGGYGSSLVIQAGSGMAPVLVTTFGFLGSLGVGFLVLFLASSGGRVSVPTLLLVGIAINTCIAGMLAAIQSLTLGDFEISRAILAWTFGTLDDRSSYHVAIVWGGLLISSSVLPFVAKELDLFGGGEGDARSLGVEVGRVKALVLMAAALSAAAAVAVAGQIAFIGLVVPHLVRLASGSSHRSLLPLSIVAGAVFLLGADLFQRYFFGDRMLQPGVVMSILGGPFFLVLVIRNRRMVEGW